MRILTEFNPDMSLVTPETYRLLQSTGLMVHRAVERVVLHGSRGPSGTFRVDSDLDLSLVVSVPPAMPDQDADVFLREVLFTTLSAWMGAIELDLAAVYDVRDCGLGCFDLRTYDTAALGGDCARLDCFGLYKVQKGFAGFVRGLGLDVRDMYPCMAIWQGDAHSI